MKKYEKYKDSGVEWIGEIPEHWFLGKIKYSDTVIMGQSPRSDDCNSEGNGLPFLQGNAEFGNLNPTPKQYCEIPNKIAEINDVLLSVRAPVGALNIANQNFGIGRGLCAIRQKKTNFKYIYYWLLHSNKELDSISTGSTFKAISLDDVKNINFPSIDIEEQTSIANYLDEKTTQIDHLITKKEELIRLLEEERTAVINQAVTKGLDPNVPMKDSGIEWLGEIPEGWEVTRVNFITSKVGDGLHGTPNYVEESNYPFINGNNIGDGKIEINQRTKFVSREEYFSNHKELNENTLLMSINGTIGNLAFYNGETIMLGKSAAYISLEPGINKEFIFYYLKSQTAGDYISMELSGSTIKNLSLHSINKLKVPFPSVEEQRSIVKHIKEEITKVDRIIKNAENEICLLKEYKTALISEVVTGKVDVRESKTT